MSKLIQEIKDDFNFVKSHTVQPKWYKIAKVFILLGFLVVYYLFFGFRATVIFFVVFMLLSTLVHLVYRTKTKKYTQSWLDFIVIEEGGEKRAKSIGRYYYSAILINALLSVLISQLLG